MTDLRKAAEMALKYFEDAYGLEDTEVAIKEALRKALNETPPCKTHPDAPHGFDRNASHSADRYVCECEGWEPVDNVYMSEERVHKTEESIHEPVCFLRETSWSYEIAPWDDPNGIPVYTAPPISDYHEGWEEGFKAATREHEPVAWMKPSGLVSPYKHGSYQIPLYTAPPKKEWVGLTDQEKYDVLEGATGDGGRVYYDTLFRCYEAKLKEKNGG
jgi:hypothetical protein